jgi:hypothetical protein
LTGTAPNLARDVALESLEDIKLFENLGFRVFRLSPTRCGEGIFCNADGAFVGLVPLLKQVRRKNCAGQQEWIVRSEAELNEKLTRLYGMSIDVATKVGGMETIARALNEGNLALAKIATVQLQFPDPPTRLRMSGAESSNLATELYCSALLKAGDWDPDEHPRTGTKPNPGHFAEKPKDPNLPAKRGWPLPIVNKKVKEWIAERAGKLVMDTGRLIIRGMPVVDAISTFLEVLSPAELNGGEDRLVAQMRTNFDPPKTFEELQQKPTENVLGYERHHIVEQTDANIEKGIQPLGECLQKFGRDKIEDPSNIVWVPRLKHELISAAYSRKVGGPGTPTLRQSLSQSDFASQRAAGLEVLRTHGVLK